MIGLSLEPLLFPRSCRLLPSQRAPGSLRLPQMIAPEDEPCDLSLLFLPAPQSADELATTATATSRAVILLSGTLAPSGPAARLLEGHLVLGSGSGIWSQQLAAGIGESALPPELAKSQRSPARGARWLILTQGRTMAERLLAAAAVARLPLCGAIASGSDAPVSWHQLALAALALTPRPSLMIGLHRTPSLAALTQVATAWPEALLYLSSSAAPPSAAPLPAENDLDTPAPGSVAHAAGLALAPSPEALVAAAALRQRGAPSRGRWVQVHADTEDGRSLLVDTLARVGIPTARPGSDRAPAEAFLPPAADAALLQQAEARWRDDQLMAVLVQHAASGPLPQLVFSPRGYCQPLWGIPASEERLQGLQALLSQSAADAPPRDRALNHKGRLAQRLLDSWPADLAELQAKQLLSCFDIASPPEQLVTSASAAGQAAHQLGAPVAVKATGPGLRHRFTSGCGILQVANAAAARQAFRDVVYACSREVPPPSLDGVLVTPMLELPRWLDCGLAWSEDAPPLLLARLLHADLPRARPLALLCPASPAAAQELASKILGAAAPDLQLHAVSRLLAQLSWLGHELADRMLWLRLDTVALPRTEGACLVIDARGQQKDSYRNPMS